jgi:hypothetical protein
LSAHREAGSRGALPVVCFDREGTMSRRLRCYLGLHRWVRKWQGDKMYLECRDCGDTKDPSRDAVGI